MSSSSSTAIPSSISQSCRRHLRILALLSLLVLAFAFNIKTTAAKPAALPGTPAIIDVPFQMDNGQTGELILEPIDEMPSQQQQQSYWVVPERRMLTVNGGQKRGSLGPRPLRFGRR